MNTKNDKINENINNLMSLMKFESNAKKIKHDAYILMAGYLSEIELILRKYKISKKVLANKIECSPSYLTQVFRGDKPLNFLTLAKIKDELNIRFEVRVIDLKEKLSNGNSTYMPTIPFDLAYHPMSIYGGELPKLPIEQLQIDQTVIPYSQSIN
jgi:ribosome-binding protein aMBF1 (putative translation factor)